MYLQASVPSSTDFRRDESVSFSSLRKVHLPCAKPCFETFLTLSFFLSPFSFNSPALEAADAAAEATAAREAASAAACAAEDKSDDEGMKFDFDEENDGDESNFMDID